MFGKLTLSSIPIDQPIIMGAGAFMALVVLAVLGTLTYTRRWKWLWTEWLTTVDHKKIGVMYVIVALVMLLRGFADAIMMRTQLALSWPWLSAAASLRPDLHRAWRHHDLLHGDGLHDWPDERHCAVADRRT
jgi:hypothetical protein